MTINELFWLVAGGLWLILAVYFLVRLLFTRPRSLLSAVWVLACTQGVGLAMRELKAMGALGAAIFGMGGFAAAVLGFVLIVTYESQARR